MLEPILKDLVSGTCEHQNLYHLLSSLSKLEGQLEDLQRIRQAVWDRMAEFSDVASFGVIRIDHQGTKLFGSISVR